MIDYGAAVRVCARARTSFRTLDLLLVAACVGCSSSGSGDAVGATFAALLSDAAADAAEHQHTDDQPAHAPDASHDAGASSDGPGEPGDAAQPEPADVDASGSSDLDAAAPPDGGHEEHDPAAHHCSMPTPIDPRDATLDPTPVILRVGSFSRDVALPQPIIDWMNELTLQPAHDAWHATRRWDDLCGISFAPAQGCEFAQALLAEDLWRAEYQQGGPGSGVAFLHMHRHMIAMLKAAFPSHASLFAGFTRVPRTRADPENPTPWRTPSWTENNLIGFDILENIEQNADLFPTEDELGVFIESNFRWTPEVPVVALNQPGAGVHGALHNQWAVNRSPVNLGRTDTALQNYTFWKLHGWIDDIWTRYRRAKGLLDTDADYLAVAEMECRLMYYLTPQHRAEAPPEWRQ